MVLVDLTADALTSIDPTTQQPVPALAVELVGRLGRHDVDLHPPRRRHVLRRLAGHRVATWPASLERRRLQGRPVAGRRPARRRSAATAPSSPARPHHFSGISATDDHTLVITTAAPDAELPLLLGSPLYGVVKLVTPASGDDGLDQHDRGRRRRRRPRSSAPARS